MKNKRGDADTWITVGKWSYYVIVIFVTSLAIIFYAGKSYSFMQAKASAPVFLEEDLLIAQLVNSCFAYEEPVGPLKGRTYQNVIDASKLTEYQLKSCTYDSVSLTITSFDNSFEAYNLRVGRTTVKNVFSQYVLVKKENTLYPAQMMVIL